MRILGLARSVACVSASLLNGGMILRRVDGPCLFTCASVGGHLAGFHHSAIVNTAAVKNPCANFCLNDCFILGVVSLGVELLGHTVIRCLNFGGVTKLQQLYIPPQQGLSIFKSS